MCKFTRSTLNNTAHARCQTARARTSKHCVFACLSLCDPVITVWVRVLANSPVLRNIPRMWWCTRKNSGKKYLIFTNFLSITSITTFFCQWTCSTKNIRKRKCEACFHWFHFRKRVMCFQYSIYFYRFNLFQLVSNGKIFLLMFTSLIHTSWKNRFIYHP